MFSYYLVLLHLLFRMLDHENVHLTPDLGIMSYHKMTLTLDKFGHL